ncbi:uncharacterized protein I303_105705 [Kwoniella dejecticola CBS 10117]|uniref:Uncharacterized protein n=1 Tax=Kwoniella dejecticola CBS 10117 TaxID=1296121 RepID=A0A1A6A057_9TREE|nr:uncharacterized protein I303_05726 [Kwoniella dejecticola CBS 10117]OBR83447.1 hypothetical protein I303_05726 [Kwoniella dejecticola CBS 10117]
MPQSSSSSLIDRIKSKSKWSSSIQGTYTLKPDVTEQYYDTINDVNTNVDDVSDKRPKYIYDCAMSSQRTTSGALRFKDDFNKYCAEVHETITQLTRQWNHPSHTSQSARSVAEATAKWERALNLKARELNLRDSKYRIVGRWVSLDEDDHPQV